jgi:hypothetical protein
MGGETSDRQWRDITAILRAQHDNLDNTYLDATAHQTGNDDLLHQARRDAT